MIFEFIPAMNGCILRTVEDDEAETEHYVTYQSSEDDGDDGSVERFVDFLHQIKEGWGPSDSRYSKKRIVIKVEPGDKYEPEEQ